MIARHDFAPFGQEIPAGVGARTSLWGATDGMSQRFTGQVRDTETGLDFFNARYMSSGLTRFTSADPQNAGADITNPQSLNGYAYVLGNPLALVDPSGMILEAPQPLPDPGDAGGNQNPDWTNFFNIFSLGYTGGSNGPVGGGGFFFRISNPHFAMTSIFPSYSPYSAGSQNSCTIGLSLARKNQGAVLRAKSSWPLLSQAGSAHGISPGLLAAIGVRETGFQNVAEADGAGVGVGVFQITVSLTSGVTAAQASSLPWAADYAANLLASNGAYLSRRFPNFTPGQLLQATAASYNMNPYKPGNFTGNPNSIDAGTARNNYGSNVVSLMDCF